MRRMITEKDIPQNIKDVEGGVEATGDVTVKEGLFAEKNASVGEDLDVGGNVQVSGAISADDGQIQFKVAIIPSSLMATIDKTATTEEVAWIRANWNATHLKHEGSDTIYLNNAFYHNDYGFTMSYEHLIHNPDDYSEIDNMSEWQLSYTESDNRVVIISNEI